MMRIASFVGLALLGCIHARTVEDAGGECGAGRDARLASSPAHMFREGALERIQEALRDRDYELEVTGLLDPATERAIEEFQTAEDLPRTGYPDHETLRRLGLDPEELYRSTVDDPR